MFEGLKQVIFEPVERIFIGEEPPKLKNDYQVIESITVQNSPDWFGDILIPLNQEKFLLPLLVREVQERAHLPN